MRTERRRSRFTGGTYPWIILIHCDDRSTTISIASTKTSGRSS